MGSLLVTEDEPDRGMDESGGFVVGADPDTIAAVHVIFPPEGETLFGIHIPFQDSGLIRDVISFRSHFTQGDCPGGALLRTFSTGFTELHYSEGAIGVALER